MSKFDDGGPAFPQKVVRGIGTDNHTVYQRKGMSLLDYYAGQAIVGLALQWLKWECVDGMTTEDESLIVGDIESGDYSLVSGKQMAETAWMLATAMIAEKRRLEMK